MPWSKEHKQATRGRIVENASSALREKGLTGVGVAELMRAAGLTHGGFYAHFGSKEALIADALEHACDQSRTTLGAAAERAPAGKKLRAVADTYLTANHMRHPETGCPTAALAAEMSRIHGPSRKAYGEHVRSRVEWMESIAEGKAEARRRAAAGTYAAMVGGLLIARAIGGTEGEKYLAEVRAFLRDSIER
jgi:TetR/AcrR family transcriptional repressor of nem operon